MTNTELLEMFTEISSVKNSFDRYILLKQNRKKYKTSAFYKNTHMSISKAYAWFMKDSLINSLFIIKKYIQPEYIGQYITNMLDHVEPDAVEQLVNRIIDNLDISQITSANQELGEMLQSLKQ